MVRTVTAYMTLFLAGCALSPAIPNERYFWPPPPDNPRVEWVHAYSSQLDLEQSGIQRFMAAIVGDDAPIPLVKPIEVKSDAANNKFFVSDIGSSRVFVFDLQKHELRFLSTGGEGPPIATPVALALDNGNNLYLLERRYNNIIVFDQNEQKIRSFNLDRIAAKPLAIAIDKGKGRLFVADGATNKIHVLDLNGNLLFSFGGPGTNKGDFNLPIAVTVNSKGEIIVADTFNARVQVFDSNGLFRRNFGRRGDGTGDFQLIKSLAVDSDDNIYVVDGRAHKLLIFSSSGELLLILGDYYAVSTSGKLAPGGFAIPISIDIDSNDRIYVVDQLNARIQIFQYLHEHRLPAQPAGK